MSAPEREGPPCKAAPEIATESGISKFNLNTLAGWAIGDHCDVPTLGRCQVIGLLPPSLLELQTAAGGVCKVGVRIPCKVRT